MHYRDITLSLMFGCIGFFLSFFAARTVNIALILLLMWVPMKVIESHGVTPDWAGFYSLKDALLGLWKVLLEIFSNTLAVATTGSLVLFVAGGIIGLVLNMKLRGKGYGMRNMLFFIDFYRVINIKFKLNPHGGLKL